MDEQQYLDAIDMGLSVYGQDLGGEPLTQDHLRAAYMAGQNAMFARLEPYIQALIDD